MRVWCNRVHVGWPLLRAERDAAAATAFGAAAVIAFAVGAAAVGALTATSAATSAAIVSYAFDTTVATAAALLTTTNAAAFGSAVTAWLARYACRARRSGGLVLVHV